MFRPLYRDTLRNCTDCWLSLVHNGSNTADSCYTRYRRYQHLLERFVPTRLEQPAILVSGQPGTLYDGYGIVFLITEHECTADDGSKYTLVSLNPEQALLSAGKIKGNQAFYEDAMVYAASEMKARVETSRLQVVGGFQDNGRFLTLESPCVDMRPFVCYTEYLLNLKEVKPRHFQDVKRANNQGFSYKEVTVEGVDLLAVKEMLSVWEPDEIVHATCQVLYGLAGTGLPESTTLEVRDSLGNIVAYTSYSIYHTGSDFEDGTCDGVFALFTSIVTNRANFVGVYCVHAMLEHCFFRKRKPVYFDPAVVVSYVSHMAYKSNKPTYLRYKTIGMLGMVKKFPLYLVLADDVGLKGSEYYPPYYVNGGWVKEIQQ